MGIFLLIIYAFAILFILMYSLSQVHLALTYYFKRKKHINDPKPAEPKEWPMVTVQLPIFNERYVIERLIDAVAAFDYPEGKLEIQVLDDSTDDTVQIVAEKIEALKATCNVPIHHVRRENRTGYKAGALQHGLQLAKGEYIAIFDADFLPPADFLKKTVPYFQDAQIGVVQTRWEHLNADYSLLTRLQAFALDAHFTVEQRGRNMSGCFINFNGTAGVWRRNTIEDAGGWQADTLTEDLDLSYRAQLKGWKFKYLEDVLSPAELPAVMGAIKSQQFRWTKGAAETAKKNLGKVIRAKLPFNTKVHATFHLMNSFLFVCILLNAVLSVPLVFIAKENEIVNTFFQYGSIFMLSLLALVVFFWISRQTREAGHGFMRFVNFLLQFPVFLAVSMGLSFHNAIATIEGYLGVKSPFIRTPKYNITGMQDNWRTRTAYLSSKLSPVTYMEGLLALYFIAAIAGSVFIQSYGMVPYHVLLAVGFSAIFYFSLRHSFLKG